MCYAILTVLNFKMKEYKLTANELKVVNNTLKVLCDESLCYVSTPAFKELTNKVFSTELYIRNIKKERQLILSIVINDLFNKWKGGSVNYCNLFAEICYNVNRKLESNTYNKLKKDR